VSPGRRSWWGWGLEESALSGDRLDGLGGLLAGFFGITPELRRPVPLEQLELRQVLTEAEPARAYAGIGLARRNVHGPESVR